MKFSSPKNQNAGFFSSFLFPQSEPPILAFQFCAGWCPSTSELEKTLPNGLTKYKEICGNCKPSRFKVWKAGKEGHFRET